jgi:hypothetical protein
MSPRIWRILIGATVVLIPLLIIFSGVALAYIRSEGPEQPIAFLHSIHAGQDKIDCQFCHRNVAKGGPATVPALEQCMFCHRLINPDNPQVTDEFNKQEISKLLQYWEEKTPVDWVRVHIVPDHVRFLHEPHIRAGFQCATCHGDVANMGRVKQVRALNMGDCLACHRQNNAPTDCTTCHK